MDTFTLVFNQTAATFYLNGGDQFVARYPTYGSQLPVVNLFINGGYYDDLSVFPYALTSSQVATLYNSGFPGICTCPTGTYQNGTECVNSCSPGFYNNMGVCSWYPANFYCLGTSAPVACPSGTCSMAGSGYLSNCTCGYFYNFDSVIVPSVNPLNICISQAEGSLSLVNSNCRYGSCMQGTNHLTDQNYRFNFDCPSNPFTISFWQYITEQAGNPFIFIDGPAGGAPTGEFIFYF